MMQTFFKQKPGLDVPYRQLEFERDEVEKGEVGALRVRLIAGEKAGREHAKELDHNYVQTFEEGLEIYDEWFHKLQKEGWRPYSPH